MRTNITITIVAFFLILSGCDRTRQDKGKEYFPDMAHSLATDTYEESTLFDNSSSALKPVEGTVPRKMIPYQFPATFDGREDAGEKLTNPVALNAETLSKGKEQYEIFCVNCHGEKGDGQGYLYTSKKYLVQPKSLITEEWEDLPGGEIYHVITVGQGVMGAHGPQISPENRWKIVHYIQEELQNK